MIRAVVWKEMREQGLIAVMLAVLGSALLVAAAMLADPPAPNAPPTDMLAALGVGRLLTLMLVITAGMVCGGALFAAEKEAGTMTFLDALPVPRWELWRAKLVAGLTLAATEVILLLGAATALGLVDGLFLRRLLVYALLAFSWGALGSTLARTTLGSVGVAIPAAALAMFVFLLPISLLFAVPGSGVPRPIGWVIFEVLMLATPLGLSAWRFTAPDRARAADLISSVGVTPNVPSRRMHSGLGIRAIAWLTLRQLRVVGPVLSTFALGSGVGLLLPEMRPVFLWPALALTAGVLAGLTAFGDEQSHRSALFWAEHRLPVGRVWLVKIGIHLAFLGWLLGLLALPCAIRSQFQPTGRGGYGQSMLASWFHSRLFDELARQGWKYLLAPGVYGFVFGHLCSLLFRKLVVACGVAAMLGGGAAVTWGPSLVAGGVKHWQLWLPAMVVLVTGRLLMRAWTADRVLDRGPLLRLTGGVVGVLIAFAVGLSYRVLQVPNASEVSEDLAFVATLPTYDDNVAGREFRTAAERFARVVAAVNQETIRPGEQQRRPRLDERLEVTARFGWSKEDPELAAWLDRVYADPDPQPWPAIVALAATRPVGVYEQPQMVSSTAVTQAALDNAKKMALVLLARALQKQAAGDSGTFIPAFRTVVALARTMRNGGGLLALTAALEVERAALYAADQWMTHFVDGHEPLLTIARIALTADDPEPFDPHQSILADRYVIRGQELAPNQWLATSLTAPGIPPDQAAAEADLVAVSWSVPWEKERTRRLIALAPEGPRPEMFAMVVGRPGAGLLIRNRSIRELTDPELQLRVARRAVILKAAIRAFQVTHGRPPSALNELVTCGYLPRLPDDPYAEGHPFGYRVSTGEELRGPARTASLGRPGEDGYIVPVPRGQAVLWSVGVDRIDHGGKCPPGGARAEDMVFLVPGPP